MKTYNPFVNTLLLFTLIASATLGPIMYPGSGNCKNKHCGNNRKTTRARSIQIIGNKMIRYYNLA